MAFDENFHSASFAADSSIGIFTGVPGQTGAASPNNGRMYRFVKVTGKYTVGLCTTKASDRSVGVLQNKPQQVGGAASVAIRGISYVESGGGATAITAGAAVTCDSVGRAIAQSGTEQVYGIALQSSSTTGELISVLLK
jgi:hypothetical protein